MESSQLNIVKMLLFFVCDIMIVFLIINECRVETSKQKKKKYRDFEAALPWHQARSCGHGDVLIEHNKKQHIYVSIVPKVL